MKTVLRCATSSVGSKLNIVDVNCYTIGVLWCSAHDLVNNVSVLTALFVWPTFLSAPDRNFYVRSIK